MFDLELSKIVNFKILDCPSGASSFVSESVSEYGMKFVTGCDVMYKLVDPNRLKSIASNDLEHMGKKLSMVMDLYKWEHYQDIGGLLKARYIPLQKFLSDYSLGIKEHRYVYGKLPKLPFKDQEFDMVLSGNLLFYYHDVFNYEFHLKSLLEFIRVSKQEVRIFPIQTPNGNLPTYFEQLMSDLTRLTDSKVSHTIKNAKYHFRKGVNRLIIIKICK
jgi:hypothetical protein